MTNNEINPFDLLSGKVVQNRFGTFWFRDAGNNIIKGGYPIIYNLHRESGPAIVAKNGNLLYKSDKYDVFTIIHANGLPDTILTIFLYDLLDLWTKK